MSDEKELNILSHLADKPGANQREIAADLEISLGSVNFVIKALIDKGWVKAGNFSKSNDKHRYIYRLTPSGIAAKINLTRHFMLRKQREYQALKAQLEQLEAQGQD
jgi:EPS-associated MarR family transcriptional regulator